MARCCGTTRWGPDRRGEAGFTLVELLVAILVLGFVALAAGAVLAAGTRSASKSESRQNLAHRAQKEVERIASLPYAAIAHPAEPGAGSANADSPLYWYSPTPKTYRWNRDAAGASTAEPLVVSAADGQVATERTWSDGNASGTVYAFITWVTDGRCGSGCPTSKNYKRVTVAVTVDSGAAAAKPVYTSSIVTDPQALPAGKIVNGNANPLADPNITCRDASGATVACTASVGSANVNEWYLSDTAAGAEYSPPTASHPTHPTIAPFGTCTTLVTVGCPRPDLLSTSAPPPPAEGSPSPPLLDYATDLATTMPHPGGRVLTRDVDCATTPTSTDNAKGAMWVTAPLVSAKSLTGAGGMTLHTQSVSGVTAAVTLCVGIYATGGSIANLIAIPPTRLGVVAYAVAEWPTAPTPISFSFDFVTGGTINVSAGQRIGVRVWVAASSGADVALLYDHPDHPSVLQLNSL
jgi:prepilin-type N-terminal cleavage/methylation domain-containing protein